MIEPVFAKLFQHFVDSKIWSNGAGGGDHHALNRRVFRQCARCRVNGADEHTIRRNNSDRRIARFEADDVGNRGIDTDAGRREYMLGDPSSITDLTFGR